MSFPRTGQVTVKQDDPSAPAIPVTGATIYVYNEDGTDAVLTSDGTASLAQPVTTGEFGVYSYFVAAAGVYREDTWFGGKLRFSEVIAIGLDGLYPPEPRAGLFFAFDAAGNPVAAAGTGGGDASLRTDLAASTGSALVGFKQSGAGAIQRTVAEHLAESTSVKDFGAVGDGVTDDSAAIQAAIDHVLATGGGTLYFPPPSSFYLLGTGLLVTSAVDANIPLRLAGSADTFLWCNTAIDILTISNTAVSGANTRAVIVDGLSFSADNAGARSIVLSNACYCQFINLDLIGPGDAIVCGTAIDDRNIGNQFTNIRITQPGNGILVSGLYNLFTNIQINEGITKEYAIQIDGQFCVVDGFVARGAGGTGGTATVVITGNAAHSIISNGTVFESYAIGVEVGAATGNRVSNVCITSSQTHGLQLNGTLQGTFDVTVIESSLASANTSNNIDCLNNPTGCTIRAQFQDTNAALDINEASGTDNIWLFGSLPNGKTISGTNTTIIGTGSLEFGGKQVVGAQQAAIANAVNAAGAPTQTEFDNFVTQFNLLLAALRTHGLIAT